MEKIPTYFKFNFILLVFDLPFKDLFHCMEVAPYGILEGYCLQSCWELMGIDLLPAEIHCTAGVYSSGLKFKVMCCCCEVCVVYQYIHTF